MWKKQPIKCEDKFLISQSSCNDSWLKKAGLITMIELQSTNRSPKHSEVVLCCLVMAGMLYSICFQTLCVLVCAVFSAVPQLSNLPQNPQALMFPQTDQQFQQSVQFKHTNWQQSGQYSKPVQQQTDQQFQQSVQQQNEQRFQKPVQPQNEQRFQRPVQRKLTSGFRSQFNHKLTSGFRSQFNDKLTSNFRSQFNGKLTSNFRSQFNGKLTSGFSSLFNHKLTSGFRSQFNGKLTSGFQQFQKPVQPQTDSGFSSQFNNMTSGFRSQFNGKLTSGFRSQFNGKLTSGFLSSFRSQWCWQSPLINVLWLIMSRSSVDNLGSVLLSVKLSTAALTDSSVTMGGQVRVLSLILFMLHRLSELTRSCTFVPVTVQCIRDGLCGSGV